MRPSQRLIRPNSAPSAVRTVSWTGAVLVLGAAAFHAPLRLWATNTVLIAHPLRLVILGGLAHSAMLILTWVLVSAGVALKVARDAVFVGGLLFLSGGSLVERFGSVAGEATSFFVILVSAAIVTRLRRLAALDALVVASAVFLALSPLGEALLPAPTSQTQVSSVEGTVISETMQRHPDIFLVVLDGYAGRLALTREFGVSTDAIDSWLRSRGFSVPSAWSAYSMTHASLPSLLDMAYVLEGGAILTEHEESKLYQMVSGDNRLVRTLRAQGYEYTMVEAGWGGSRCGAQVDHCVVAPVVDDAVETLLDGTLLKPWVDAVIGHAFTHGARRTMEWLLVHGSDLALNSQPDFVFAHVLAPHPPALLDRQCSLRFDPRLEAKTFVAEEDRLLQQSAYLEQLECVNDFVREFIDTLPANAVVVLTGDHGSDSRLQLLRDPARWSFDDLAERMNVFLAMRLPPGCDSGDTMLLPNVMRLVLACLEGARVPEAEARLFGVVTLRGADGAPIPVREIDPTVVRLLLTEGRIRAAASVGSGECLRQGATTPHPCRVGDEGPSATPPERLVGDRYPGRVLAQEIRRLM